MASKKLTDASTDKQIRADFIMKKNYGDLFDKFPNHPVVLERGVLRWKSNSLMCWLGDTYTPYNAMAIAYQRKQFSIEDYMKFYRDIGYSLCGFAEIFGDGTQYKVIFWKSNT